MSYQDTATTHATASAFFDTRDAAETAVADLVKAGISRDRITIKASDDTTSAATTGAEKGFWESLKEMFVPDDDRYAYSEGVRRGGSVVLVRTDAGSYDQVVELLDSEGAVDLDERTDSWRTEGWKGYEASDTAAVGSAAATSARPMSASVVDTAATVSGSATAKSGQDEVIPVYEERLQVGKRDVNHGRVRVRSYVVETPVSEQVSLRDENVEVIRKPVDRAIGAADAMFQDRVIEAEEHTEEAVVAKEARVKEEITLRKTAQERTQTVTDSVRHTEVDVQDERAQGKAFVGSTAEIAEHMDVVSSDGMKIGMVDHLEGTDRIKLAKSTSPDGQHHYIPMAWVDRVDTSVRLSKTAAEAKASW